jgi:hypothetical protein
MKLRQPHKYVPISLETTNCPQPENSATRQWVTERRDADHVFSTTK